MKKMNVKIKAEGRIKSLNKSKGEKKDVKR